MSVAKYIWEKTLIFSQKSLSRLRLYSAAASCLNTPCRDNLPLRRRSNSYGGTSKRGGFSEELILPSAAQFYWAMEGKPYHFDFRTIPKSFEIHLNRQPDYSWTQRLQTPADVFEPQSRQMRMIGKASLEHWLPDDTEHAPDQDCYEEYSPPPGQSFCYPNTKQFTHKWQPFPEECSSQIHRHFLSSPQLYILMRLYFLCITLLRYAQSLFGRKFILNIGGDMIEISPNHHLINSNLI